MFQPIKKESIMRIIQNCFVLMLVFNFNVSISGAQEKQGMKDDTSDLTLLEFKDIRINVPTIKCGSCVKTVSTALAAVEGVKEVNVDKKKKIALVKYDASRVTPSDLETAIAKSGYDANATKRDNEAYQNLDACCR